LVRVDDAAHAYASHDPANSSLVSGPHLVAEGAWKTDRRVAGWYKKDMRAETITSTKRRQTVLVRNEYNEGEQASARLVTIDRSPGAVLRVTRDIVPEALAKLKAFEASRGHGAFKIGQTSFSLRGKSLQVVVTYADKKDLKRWREFRFSSGEWKNGSFGD